MTTVQVPTSKLVGTALDWAVLAATEGNSGALAKMRAMASRLDRPADILGGFHPSFDWSQGGLLIDRYRIEFYDQGEEYTAIIDKGGEKCWGCGCSMGKDDPHANGSNHLIAAMRAIVAAELGRTVEIPKELAK